MERYNPSKLVLGSVQFGIPYGVSNSEGQTSREQVSRILDLAYQAGIRSIDTAANYGNAENVLGDEVDNIKDWQIITKIPPISEERISLPQIEKTRAAFFNSLEKLRVENLEGVLVHACEDLFKKGGDVLFQELANIKSEGHIKKIGVSIYNGEQIIRIINRFDIDLVQLPINIIDQRLIYGGHLPLLKKHNIEVHARSIFLQGLLLMDVAELPPYFKPIEAKLRDVKEKAVENSFKLLELLLGYISGIKEVDKVVIGVNSVEQLKEILSCKKKVLPIDDYKNLAVNEPKYVDPTNWDL
jgi:aryl-alcohol dehydrogenase-like predicted oxidoreductase